MYLWATGLSLLPIEIGLSPREAFSASPPVAAGGAQPGVPGLGHRVARDTGPQQPDPQPTPAELGNLLLEVTLNSRRKLGPPRVQSIDLADYRSTSTSLPLRGVVMT